jgi:hypothetical protein
MGGSETVLWVELENRILNPILILIATSWVNGALPAVFGFLGVVAGALLTPLMNRRLEERRDVEQARTAWRLLRQDTAGALRAIREREERGEWPINWKRDWSSVWRSSRGVLARRVANSDRFKCLAEVFESMDSLESAMNTHRSEEKRHLSAGDRRFLERTTRLLHRAEEALDAELDDPDFSPARPDGTASTTPSR